jgi:tRNA U34 5-methylaminomethyl-2-thiouridine-forming methyltransferase MnmC
MLERNNDAEIRMLEMGFGTGLNAFLTAIEAEKMTDRLFVYDAVELNPLAPAFTKALNYSELLGNEHLFEAIHEAPWNVATQLHKRFALNKIQGDLLDVVIGNNYHLIYYDAFAPEAQPELWTEEVFKKLYSALVDGGILVTYCSKGSVRRAMKAAGFTVKKLAGPPGKWEIVRAEKKNYKAE